MKFHAIVFFTLCLCVPCVIADVSLSMTAGEGTAAKVLPDGRPAIQFDATAPQRTQVKWNFKSPIPAGWHTVEIGFGPESGTRKLVDFELQDAQNHVVLKLDLYHIPSRTGKNPTTQFGIFLTHPVSSLVWRKNQQRHMASAPLVSLSLRAGRPADDHAFMLAVETPIKDDGNLALPADMPGQLIRAASSRPVSLTWELSDGKSFRTPRSEDTTVFLAAQPRVILAECDAEQPRPIVHLERRPDSTSPVPAEIMNRPVIPLLPGGQQHITIDIVGANLNPDSVSIADFPHGARMAAVQSWDDGIPADRRTAQLLAKHGWRGTFFFNHNSAMVDNWKELEDLGMEVGTHSWSHPAYWLQSPKRCRDESLSIRLFLEQRVQHPVISFAYPFNYRPAYDLAGDYVLRAQSDAQYLSCRSTESGLLRLDDLGNPLAMSTNGHFLMPREKIEQAWKSASNTPLGVFYIWGHSYEMTKEAEWDAFENLLKVYGKRSEAWYAAQGDLMVWQWMRSQVRVHATGSANHLRITLERPVLHPWWAARVPVALKFSGAIQSATLNNQNLEIIANQVQIPWQ